MVEHADGVWQVEEWHEAMVDNWEARVRHDALVGEQGVVHDAGEAGRRGEKA